MTNENENIHESDTGVQTFDVNAHIEQEPQAQPVKQTQQAQPVVQPQQIQQAQPVEQPQQPDTFETILAQKDAQISALIEQTKSLTQQITQMVQGGAQFTDNTAPQTQQASPMQHFNPPAMSDDIDYSLESLAKEIGKPTRR